MNLLLNRQSPKAAFAAIWLALNIAGCAVVGPDYIPPEIQSPATWNSTPAQGLSAPVANPRMLAEWWKTFNDPVLSDLIERAVAGNSDIKKAKTRIREARARRGITEAQDFPKIDGSGSVTTRRSNGSESRLYSVGFDAGWELDIFGGIIRSVEAAEANIASEQENLRDVLVSLLAETALNYIEVRTYQSRLEVAEANLAAQMETYRLTQARYKAGLGDELAVQQARYNLEQTRSRIPTLNAGLESAKNRIAVLLGKYPGSVHEELKAHKPIPVTRSEIAVGIPADILRRRPDIRRAERNLAAQTARIGVAMADLYPKLTLNGSLGLDSPSSGSLFSGDSLGHSFGPRISLPIFDAGAIRQNIEVQFALSEQALIQYESSVLAALEEVENALTVYAEEQNRRRSLSEGTRAAQQAAVLAENKYAAGLTDFNNVLEAQRSLLNLQDQMAESSGNIIADLVRLYKALGGGWAE